MRDTPRASPTSPEAAEELRRQLADHRESMRRAVAKLPDRLALVVERNYHDGRAQEIGWTDADAFLAAADRHLGPWTEKDYRYIFMGSDRHKR